jgi:hypothetical protein
MRCKAVGSTERQRSSRRLRRILRMIELPTVPVPSAQRLVAYQAEE